MGQKKEIFFMSYLNSVTIVGFVGADPEQRHTKGNGSKFTVFSVATQRSWKNAEDEWVSKTEWHRVSIFRPRLAEYVSAVIKKGSHVLIEGSLASSTYERPNGKGKKSATTKITSWTIRADMVRRLDRGEPEAIAAGSAASEQPSETSATAPF
jgi:single stranded DNA-binding protein